MNKAWINELEKIFYIAMKDVKIYFFKGPNLTFGLLLPLVLYFAFSIGRAVEPTFAIPGLVAIAAFFGAGAIQAVSLPLERRTGTFAMLLTAPTSLSTILLGKTLAGFFFGTFLSILFTLILLPFSPLPNILPFFLATLISSFMFSIFGLLLSVPFRDIPDAMPPATVVRVAMVFICGIFMPLETLPASLQTVAYTLPLTYSVDALRKAMSASLNAQFFLIDLAVQILFSLIFLVVTIKLLQRTIE